MSQTYKLPKRREALDRTFALHEVRRAATIDILELAGVSWSGLHFEERFDLLDAVQERGCPPERAVARFTGHHVPLSPPRAA